MNLKKKKIMYFNNYDELDNYISPEITGINND